MKSITKDLPVVCDHLRIFRFPILRSLRVFLPAPRLDVRKSDGIVAPGLHFPLVFPEAINQLSE